MQLPKTLLRKMLLGRASENSTYSRSVCVVRCIFVNLQCKIAARSTADPNPRAGAHALNATNEN